MARSRSESKWSSSRVPTPYHPHHVLEKKLACQLGARIICDQLARYGGDLDPWFGNVIHPPGSRKPEAGSRKPEAENPAWSRLEALVREYRETMVHFAIACTRDSDRADGEGIVQDALVRLLTKNVTWQDSDRECLALVRGYIRNVARNRVQRASDKGHEPIEHHPLALPLDPWREAWRLRARDAFTIALDELTPAQREVAVMRLLLGLSFPEIADARACSENTAKVLHQRARVRLRNALGMLQADVSAPDGGGDEDGSDA